MCSFRGELVLYGFAGGFAVELDLSGDVGGEPGFAGCVAVAGVGPVGEGERGRLRAVVRVRQPEGGSLLGGAVVGADLA